MNATKRNAIVSEVDRQELIGIKAGTGDHRFLSIWMVVVDENIYARSWGNKNGWYNAFKVEPHGEISIESTTYKVTAEFIRKDDPINDLIDFAYEKKYNQKKYEKYVRDLQTDISRGSTIRLLPEDASLHTK